MNEPDFTLPKTNFPICPNHLQRHMDYALCDCNGKTIDWLAVGMKYANLRRRGVPNGQTIQ